MAKPRGISDAEYIAQLEKINSALSFAMNQLKTKTEEMLVEKDRALFEKCKTCRGSHI